MSCSLQRGQRLVGTAVERHPGAAQAGVGVVLALSPGEGFLSMPEGGPRRLEAEVLLPVVVHVVVWWCVV